MSAPLRLDRATAEAQGPVAGQNIASLPPPHLALLGMFLGGSLAGLLMILLPRTGPLDTSALLKVIASGLLISAALWAFGARLKTRALLALTLYACLAIAVADLTSGSPRRPFTTFQFWPVLFAASYLPRRGLILTLCAAGLGSWAALVYGDSLGDGALRCFAQVTSLTLTGLVLGGARARTARLLDTLEVHARTDPLCGLLNRRAFEEILDREIRLCRRHDRTLALVILDLDHFKAVNDRLGHPAGDAALRVVALTLVQRIRETDDAFRLGGDEFALLLRSCDATRAAEIAREIGAAVVEEGLTLSAGVAACPQHGQTARRVVAAADAALYQAKEAGRARVEIAEDG